MKTTTTILILTLVFGAMLIAQPNRMPGKHGDGPRSVEMEKRMAQRLTEHLELTSEQADEFFPKMKAHREKLRNIDMKIRESASTIREKMDDDKNISDSEFNSVFHKITALEKQKLDEKTRFMKSLDGVLDNNQKVELVVFKDHFAKEMRKELREKRRDLGEARKRLGKARKELGEEKQEVRRLKKYH